MKSSQAIEFCAKLEETLDECLFRTREDEERDATGALIATGAGAAAVGGGVVGHRAIMKNYGGEGGATQAYKNLGRNVGAVASDKSAATLEALKAAKKRATAGFFRGRGLGGANGTLAGVKGALGAVIRRTI